MEVHQRRGKGAELSLGDMAAALRAMPEFQAATAALNKHMSLAHDALSAFKSLGLLELSQLEQTLATGVDADGDAVRPRDVLADVLALLSSAAAAKRPDAKGHALRLLACYVVAQGGRLAEGERAQLFGALQPDAAQQRSLLALARAVADAGGALPSAADARVSAAAAETRTKASTKKRSNLAAFRSAMRATFASSKGGAADAEDDDLGNRYAPPARALMAALCDGALDADAYPSVNGPRTPAKPAKAQAQSVRKNASRLAGRSKRTRAGFAGPKLVVVVLGGATYSELRAAYEISKDKNREIFLGGSSLLTPDAFLAGLRA